ncbi:uncharacterized protein DUF3667 [Nonlabens dokdonensis]|jgi:hypothetical protein|uniref:DUF3667 domain-containing protein n=2 Tax=Nonlabens dokdonensis TaxID=328515 RepID=L7W9M3_NONDD|nr:DUF3667 domain-containing protein [Nonlabens dokdonensis]AGC75588.1 hypothetical protein DDD_0461 [Nonlabens dokdonensis DSW-6]PZX43281.1 uncharacterized protein DUF3667 [Nonlabens dokdonensis]
MERNCKNCNELIYAGKNHCANCGCKWIENRITMRQVGNDFADMYLGFDTKFVRTFVDLFKKPEAVILGYMNGRRVNYMDAVRYILLSLFVTGIYTFVLKQTGAIDKIIDSQAAATMEAYMDMGMPEQQAIESTAQAQKFTQQIFEFQGFFLLLTIPLLAFAARLTFWGKRYFNFTEQIVFYLYTYSHFVMATTPITILLVFFAPDYFSYLGFVTFPLLYLYNAYCYKKCFNLNNATIITKTLVSIFIIIGVFIASGILIGIVGIIVGLILKATGVL